MVARPDAALLMPGLIPFASLFVVESAEQMQAVLPEFKVDRAALNLVRPARHRTKLLLAGSDDVNGVVASFHGIIEAEREYYASLHSGFLSPLRRLLQGDLGFCRIDDHIISTTHATRFLCDIHAHDPEYLRNIGCVVSAYCTEFLRSFGPNVPLEAFPPVELSKPVQTDVKSGSLYRRGPLGELDERWSAVLTIVLATVNYVRIVLANLAPVSLTHLKLRCLTSINAIRSLQFVQDRLRGEGGAPPRARAILGKALCSPESRWFRKRDDLRDLLVHFSPRPVKPECSDFSLQDALTHYSRTSLLELGANADTLLEHLATVLAEGYALNKSSFWYGVVPEDAG
jgi:hypothetical protein